MSPQKKIAISTGKDITFIYEEAIMYVRSEGSYSTIFIEGEKPIMLSKSLKELSNKLPQDQFYRIHHGHIINLRFVEKYIEDGEDYVIMSDGSKHLVSRRKKSDFLAQFVKL